MNDIIITPLGTVSPYPKGNMNCPGILVEYKDKKLLLDCGNGITRLLKFPEDLINLSIFITHYHRDHFADIGAIQYASYVYHNLGLLDKRVNIFFPEDDKFSNKDFIFFNTESFTHFIDIDELEEYAIDDMDIIFRDNESHSIKSYMIKLQSKDFKVVYTSDIGTKNFDKLIKFCYNSDLIICESSLLRKYKSNCNTHMTAYDAGLLAKEANAKKLLLTHFWPEENKMSYLEEAKEVFENTDVAIEGKKLILHK